MKRIILFCLLASIASGLQSQTRKYFCEIKGIENVLSSGLKIVFDFGSSKVYSIWDGLKGNQKLVDENGKEIKFNSMVDAGNYMVQKGWTFQQAYSSSFQGSPIIHWIFYKEAQSAEEAAVGLETKETFKKKNQ